MIPVLENCTVKLCVQERTSKPQKDKGKVGSMEVDDSRPLSDILEQAKNRDNKKISACPGLRGRENQVEQGY